MKSFADQKAGAAIPESICTSRAVGVSQVSIVLAIILK